MAIPPPGQSTRYRWPWFVLAALILGILVTLLWILGAVRKVKRIRESTGQAAVISPVTPKSSVTNGDLARTNGMVWIPSGTFSMGSDNGQPDERPIHDAYVEARNCKKKGLAADAKEVGVRNPAEENVLLSRPKIFEG